MILCIGYHVKFALFGYIETVQILLMTMTLFVLFVNNSITGIHFSHCHFVKIFVVCLRSVQISIKLVILN